MEYKRLGDYIRPVDVRNSELKVTNLLGLSMSKKFRPSTSNIVGVDLSIYKVVNKNVFAFDPMSVIRVHKVPIALNDSETPIIVSPAYFTFECKDSNELDPRYLMMWFKRTEFDRYADFKSDSAIRGGYNWDELCDTIIHVPSIDRQREIVSEYETLSNRIRLNEQMIANLEETAQALYRKMFVDGVDKENLPEGWRKGKLGEIACCFDSKRRPLAGYDRVDMEKKYPYYGAAALMDYVDNYLFDGTYILMGEDGTVINEDNTPVIQYVTGKFWVNNHAHVLKGINGFDENLLYLILKKTKISEYVTGGVQAKINQENMMSIPVLIPTPKELEIITMNIQPLFKLLLTQQQENERLTELQSLLLARMGE